MKHLIPPPVKEALKKGMGKYRQLTWKRRLSPSFIVIGAQKCGTSSLYNYLAQHPQIVPSYKKEVHYFDGGLERTQRNYQRGEKWYRSHFARNTAVNRSRLAFEASPMYVFNPLAPARIHQFNPDMKLILMVRNPVERAISHYYHEVQNGREALPLLAALEAEDKRLAACLEKRDYHDPDFKNYSYKARGMYAHQLQRYLEYFDAGNILIIGSEDFFAETEKSLSDIFLFLGVSQDFLPPNLAPINVSKIRKRAQEDPRARAYLENVFAEPNRQFYELAGRTFGW